MPLKTIKVHTPQKTFIEKPLQVLCIGFENIGNGIGINPWIWPHSIIKS